MNTDIRPDLGIVYAIEVYILSVPFFIAPFIVGRRLLKEAAGPNSLKSLAGWLTLKPLVTTPLWACALGTFYPTNSQVQLEPAYILSILPGVGLSLLAFLLFQSLFFEEHSWPAWVLLGLDCLRWLNSFVMYLIPLWISGGGLGCACIAIGLGLPTVFALVAQVVVTDSQPTAE